MTRLAAWQINDSGPKRLSTGAVSLENDLEGWIATDPSLLGPGLRVIQRQLHVDGGRLDLLCVDTQGRATVVEIKRGQLIRDVVAQAIDYAASIAAMPAETLRSHVLAYADSEQILEDPAIRSLLEDEGSERREVDMIVVGTGADQGLERMLEFLESGFSFPMRAITFDVFALETGEQVLVREEREPEQEVQVAGAKWTREDVIARVGGAESPAGRRMSLLADAATRAGLYVRPFKWTLMFAPPTRKNRYLMTVWYVPSGEPLPVTYSADAFAEFFPQLTPEGVRAVLGPDDSTQAHREIASDKDAEELGRQLGSLFAADHALEVVA